MDQSNIYVSPVIISAFASLLKGLYTSTAFSQFGCFVWFEVSRSASKSTKWKTKRLQQQNSIDILRQQKVKKMSFKKADMAFITPFIMTSNFPAWIQGFPDKPQISHNFSMLLNSEGMLKTKKTIPNMDAVGQMPTFRF